MNLSDIQKSMLAKLAESRGWLTEKQLGASGNEQSFLDEASSLEYGGYIELRTKNRDISSRAPRFDARITEDGKQALQEL